MAVYRVTSQISPDSIRYRNGKEDATFVQAWEVTTTNGDYVRTVYTAKVAADQIAKGYNIQIITIVRFDNGDRAYNRGTLANVIAEYFETLDDYSKVIL